MVHESSLLFHNYILGMIAGFLDGRVQHKATQIDEKHKPLLLIAPNKKRLPLETYSTKHAGTITANWNYRRHLWMASGVGGLDGASWGSWSWAF